MSQESFSSLFHFNQYHWGYFFRCESFHLSFVFNLHFWFSAIRINHFEWPVFHICLDSWIIELSANQPFRICTHVQYKTYVVPLQYWNMVPFHYNIILQWYHSGTIYMSDKTIIKLLTKYGVMRIHCNLIFRSITNQSFRISKCDVWRCCSISWAAIFFEIQQNLCSFAWNWVFYIGLFPTFFFYFYSSLQCIFLTKRFKIAQIFYSHLSIILLMSHCVQLWTSNFLLPQFFALKFQLLAPIIKSRN